MLTLHTNCGAVGIILTSGLDAEDDVDAQLAEAAEDRINSLTMELENLLDYDGLPSKDEDRNEIVDLARQIKCCQEQYNQLVNGEASATLNMLNVDSESHDVDMGFQ